MNMTSYEATLRYLYNQLPMFQRVGKRAFKGKLTNTRALCAALGDPQQQFKSVHIAGTNGKGSTTHLLAGLYQTAGYRVGVYTSPHYRDFRERIKINGQYISEQEVVDFVEQYRPLFEEIQPSFFEMTVAMAFDHFRRHAVDLAVVETGLGGRLDSTNVLLPLLSVITNIGYDHQAQLGDTLEAIAGEKAGIIKPQTPVVIGETHPETQAVFMAKAQANEAELVFADQVLTVTHQSTTLRGATYQVQSSVYPLQLDQLELGLAGPHQQQNLCTALASTQLLKAQGFDLTEDQIRTALRDVAQRTGMMGRWQILAEAPLTIADSSHNQPGWEHTVQALAQYPVQQWHVVLGTVRNKDINYLWNLLPPEALYYFCKADLPRGLPAEELLAQAQAAGYQGQAYSSVSAAYQAAQHAAQPEDGIFIGGSIFVVAEII